MTSSLKAKSTPDKSTSFSGKSAGKDKAKSGFDALLEGYNSEEDDDFDPDADDDEDDENMDSDSEDGQDEDDEEDGNDGENKDKNGEHDHSRVPAEVTSSLAGTKRKREDSKDKHEVGDKRIRNGGEKVLMMDGEEDWGSDSGEDYVGSEDEEDEEEEEEGSDNEKDGSFRNGEEKASEGGFIKTRSQKAREQKEKIPLASTTGATANVESLWEKMNQPTWKKLKGKEEEATVAVATTTATENGTSTTNSATSTSSTITNSTLPLTSATTTTEIDRTKPTIITKDGTEMLLIQRTYEFAGTKHTEEKLVPLTSQEAKLYLASLAPPPTNSQSDKKPTVRRPLRRQSQFDTFNPPPRQKPVKLNTLEKSRLDWAGFVDKEGLADDLERYGKSSEKFVDRQGFLAKVEEKKADILREARKGAR